MNIFELRQLSETELNDRIRELREEIYNLRFQKATRQASDTKRVGILRREIARICTVLRENTLGIRRLNTAKPETAGE
jgi:large subunit ribosomal protein L29